MVEFFPGSEVRAFRMESFSSSGRRGRKGVTSESAGSILQSEERLGLDPLLEQDGEKRRENPLDAVLLPLHGEGIAGQNEGVQTSQASGSKSHRAVSPSCPLRKKYNRIDSFSGKCEFPGKRGIALLSKAFFIQTAGVVVGIINPEQGFPPR